MKILLFTFLSYLTIGISHADTPEPIVAYACDTKNNEITFINTRDVRFDPPSKYFQSDDELLSHYNPWDLVTFTEDEKGTRINDTTYIETDCILNNGTYTIYINPEVFNPNVLGRCGYAISGNVSVLMGNIVILKETALVTNCHDNQFIRKIRIIFEKKINSGGHVNYVVEITKTESSYY